MVNTEAMIFNRISWLEFYGEKPVPEGEAIESAASKSPEEVASENNFLADDKGKAHGLVQAKTLNMGRLGARGGESFMFGTVVSVAPHPDGVRQVVVGWQAHAEIMARPRTHKPSGRVYNYRAPHEHAVLLPVEARTIEVPRKAGGIGQAVMAYAVDAKGAVLPWAKEAAEAIAAYDGPNLFKKES